MDDLFPKVKKSIASLIEDEEGNIPGNKLLMLGTMVIILGSILTMDAFGSHRSHSSHRSHRSHSSSRSGGSHYSHVSHQSHVSSSAHSNHSNHGNHSSHQSHTSHSNQASHSNSRYSAEGDVAYAPAASRIPGIKVPAVASTQEVFKLPKVNQNIEIPNSTPYSGLVSKTAIPLSTPGTQIDTDVLNTPSATKQIK